MRRARQLPRLAWKTTARGNAARAERKRRARVRKERRVPLSSVSPRRSSNYTAQNLKKQGLRKAGEKVGAQARLFYMPLVFSSFGYPRLCWWCAPTRAQFILGSAVNLDTVPFLVRGFVLVLSYFLGGVSCVVFLVLFLFCGCLPPPFPPLAVVLGVSFLLASLCLSCVVLFLWGGVSGLVLPALFLPSRSGSVGSGVPCGASRVFCAFPSSSSSPLRAVVLCLLAAVAVVVGWSCCRPSCRGVSSFWCGLAVLGLRSSRSFVARGLKIDINQTKKNGSAQSASP